MGTDTFQSPEIGTLVFTEQQLTKIILYEEEALVGTFSDYCENY